MKILITSFYNSPNIYVKSIADALMKMENVEVLCSIDAFWNTNIHFDIIHIQWPEEVLFWKSPTVELLKNLKEKILYWKNKGSKIVVTRHNNLPHNSKELSESLYKMVYGCADAIIHLGNYSKENLSSDNAINEVILHPNYNSLISENNNQNLKELFKIPNQAKVLLSFGAIRKQKEEDLLIDAFQKFQKNNKNVYLVICNPIFPSKKVGYRSSVISRLKWERKKYLYDKTNIIFAESKVPNEKLNSYMDLSDVIITPRFEVLNSGVVFLAMTYGKPIVAPDTGNITEIMNKTGNPLFEIGNKKSLSQAIDMAFSQEEKLGKGNKDFSDQYCDVEDIALQHFHIYSKIMYKN